MSEDSNEKIEEKPTEEAIPRNESGIPGFGFRRDLSSDSAVPTTTFEAFRQPGKYLGYEQGYGGPLQDRWRLFYSTREPVGVWWVRGIADDIWDNWFKIIDIENPDSDELDKKTQKELAKLKAKTQLPRETVFERRYGTAILLLSYSGDTDWETPLPEDNNGELLQITPYPYTATAIDVSEVDGDEESQRFGLPLYYKVTRGSATSDASAIPYGTTTTDTLNVHWTRVIHDAPRLDEHPYLGLSVLDCIFDDLVGGRNARWGMYNGYFRHGQGFPVVKTKGTRAENEAWITSGGLDTFLNARGYMVMGADEEFDFKGAQASALNPSTYFDVYFTFIAAATGVAKDSIQGVSAGRVTGNESNERKYFKAITLQQHKKEPMLRELIDRLIDTGQIDFAGDYEIDWIDPFEVNPQDKAAIEFMEARTNALKTYMTINEMRALEGLPDIEGGEELMLQPGQMPFGGGGGEAENQEEPSPAETEPEETEQTEGNLLDKVMDK